MTLLIIGCSPTPTKLIEQRRIEINRKLADINAIGRLVSENNALKRENLEIIGQAPTFAPFTQKTNAVIVGPEHFAGYGPDSLDFKAVADNPFADTLALLADGKLANGKLPSDSDAVNKIFNTLIDLRYILVVRIRQFNPPSVQGASFQGGSAAGDLMMYEVKTRQLLGGFRFNVKNSANVNPGKENQYLYLMQDLRKNLSTLIREEFKKRYPDDNPPLTNQ
jgi:hypothetical protein